MCCTIQYNAWFDNDNNSRVRYSQILEEGCAVAYRKAVKSTKGINQQIGRSAKGIFNGAEWQGISRALVVSHGVQRTEEVWLCKKCNYMTVDAGRRAFRGVTDSGGVS